MSEVISNKGVLQNDDVISNRGESMRILQNDELDIVAGGRKAGERPLEYLLVKMEDLIISSY